jgi:hypothetical protein
MHYYDTEYMYLQKRAGLGTAAYQLLQSEVLQHDDEKQEQQAAMLNEIARELEEERIRPAVEALRHTPVHAGMERLASVAAHAGADMAKKAGIVGSVVGGLAKSPTARKVVGGAALVGGGLLAAKAINKVPQELGREAGPRTFGSGRFGFNPAFGVNAYGQPQVGTPLV